MELYAHLPTVGPTKSGSTAEHVVLTDRGSPCQYLTIKKKKEKKNIPLSSQHICETWAPRLSLIR